MRLILGLSVAKAQDTPFWSRRLSRRKPAAGGVPSTSTIVALTASARSKVGPQGKRTREYRRRSTQNKGFTY